LLDEPLLANSFKTKKC